MASSPKLAIMKSAKILEFSRASWYYQSKLEPKDKKLANAITYIHDEEDDTLGHKKLASMLNTGKNRVKRVMKKYGIKARRKQKKYVYPGKASQIFANLANNPIVKDILGFNIIFSDIFEFKLADGCRLRGCFAILKQTRQVLSMVFDYFMKAELVATTIQKIDFYHYDDTIWHTDQGKQYGAKETVYQLVKKGFIASMSRAGTPTDNPFAERFIGTFKHAVVRKQKYYSLGEFLKAAEKWINFYNQRRPHESLNQLSPNEFAKKNNYQIVPYLSNLTV